MSTYKGNATYRFFFIPFKASVSLSAQYYLLKIQMFCIIFFCIIYILLVFSHKNVEKLSGKLYNIGQ